MNEINESNKLMKNIYSETNCVICLEPVDIYIYPNKCKCKLQIHKNCFQSWINLHNSCIICKTELSTFNEELSIKIKYFNKEFKNSKLLIYLDFVMSHVAKISEKIKNELIKYFLFNVLFGCFAFLNLIIIIIYIGTLSQCKYLLDYYKKKNIYNPPYKFIFIKN